MQAILKALSWTFVHSLWQGIFAALFAAIIISVTKRSTAKLRYNLLGTVLVLFLTTSLFTFLITLRQQKELSAVTTADTAVSYSTTYNTTDAEAPATVITTITNWFNNNSGLVLLLWLLFFSLNCLKLITGLASVQRLRNYKIHPIPEEWKIKLLQLRSKLGIRQTINLLQSELVKVPVALGCLKPVILLPVGLINNLPAEQVEAILLHELGHIRRSDYMVNLLQHFAEAIFFFNPAMLWISSLLRQERESCCDEIVLACTNQKRNYLDALISFQEYSLHHTTYTMAISGRKQYLLNRVKRIITNENKRLNIVEKLALLSGLLLFSAFTYINREKEIKEPIITETIAQYSILPQSTVPEDGEHAVVMKEEPIEKKIKINNRNSQLPLYSVKAMEIMPVSMAASIKDKFSQLGIDSIPVTDKKVPQIKKKEISLQEKQIDEKPATEVEKKLGEIIKLKEHIGEKKETIGKKKALLEKSSEKDKEKILKEIEDERKEIELKRSDLEKKRSEYQNLKKEEDNNRYREKIQEKKWEIKKDDKNTNAKFDLKSTLTASKVIEFKMIDLKEIKVDQQFKIAPPKKSPPSPKTEKQSIPDNAPSQMKTRSSTPVRI